MVTALAAPIVAWPRQDVLEGLNDQQLKAVLSVEGPLLVSAGAGSGKTRVLTQRIAHLILNHGVAPGEILGITFTRKAAEEMRERLARILDAETAAQVALLTFHALGTRLLREYGGPLGLSGRFGISDEHDSAARLRTVLRTLGVSRAATGETPSEVQERISNAKSIFADRVARTMLGGRQAGVPEALESYRSGEGAVWREIGETLGAPDPEGFAAQYAAYQAVLLRDQVVDFNDLITLPLLLFLQRPEIGRLAAAQWQHILVDEYQDTDFTQDHLLRILAAPHLNLCVVGDAAQAIYSWRQARVENILTFAERYAPCPTIVLDQNYRSTPEILSVANAVLENRPEIGGQARLWTSAPTGPVPRVWTCTSEDVEANAIAEDIEHARATGEIADYSDVMVLYRLNALARRLESAFQRRSIPYRIVNNLALYERKEIRDMLAFLRVTENPFDQTSFERAAGSYANGVGPSTLEALFGFARATGQDLLAAATNADEYIGVRPQHLAALRSLGDLIVRVREQTTSRGALAALRLVLEETGIRTSILKAAAEAEAEDDEEELARLEQRLNDIEDFFLYAEELERRVCARGNVLAAGELLDHLALLTPSESTVTDSDTAAVTLMTIHAAKGLEASRVYVVGLEEHVLPAYRTADKFREDGEADERLAEEARLFYVAITRSRGQLILSASRTRELVRDDPRPMNRSRFLAALPEMGYRAEILR